MDDLEAGVLTIVQDFSNKTIPLPAELYHDLHILGDDAAELLDAIHKKYGTSFERFNFSAYFPDETLGLPRFAKWLGVKDKKFGTFTVAQLIAVVRKGHWFDPV